MFIEIINYQFDRWFINEFERTVTIYYEQDMSKVSYLFLISTSKEVVGSTIYINLNLT